MKTVMLITMAVILTTGSLVGTAFAQAPPTPAKEQPEVLTRGPVNEAFAQPVNLENQAGLVAPSQPPADINEIPPVEKPAGDQFAWVPGYWAWDSDRSGYIWVSGCWRAVPPDMSWVPGYWSQVAGGWQWVPGFWAPAGNNEISYLPAPPELTDVAAPGPAPSPDKIWVPPCWYWHNGQYVRRSGYWLAAQADWVWVPSHYVWTPRGYVFASGHWDYALDRRGVLFAPVYFPSPIYRRPGYAYSLNIAVDIGNLQFGLFSRPLYSHYYFGDYYDSAYISIGIFPWYEFEQRHSWYDPIYMHDRWRHHRDEPRWEQRERREYARRQADPRLRPPRTYREMEGRMSKLPASQRRNVAIAQPMARLATGRTTPFRYERIEPQARRQIIRRADDVHKFGADRGHWESQGARHPSDQRVPTGRGPAAGRQDTTSPPRRQGSEMQPSPRMGAPAPGQGTRNGEPAGRGRKDSPISSGQQRPADVSAPATGHNQPDKVVVRTSPVSGKRHQAAGRKKPPTQPNDEEKSEGRSRE